MDLNRTLKNDWRLSVFGLQGMIFTVPAGITVIVPGRQPQC